MIDASHGQNLTKLEAKIEWNLLPDMVYIDVAYDVITAISTVTI